MIFMEFVKMTSVLVELGFACLTYSQLFTSMGPTAATGGVGVFNMEDLDLLGRDSWLDKSVSVASNPARN